MSVREEMAGESAWIDELERLHLAATPAPWELHPDSRPDVVCGDEHNSGYFGDGHLFAMDKYGKPLGQGYDNMTDAALLVELRNRCPEILAALRASLRTAAGGT